MKPFLGIDLTTNKKNKEINGKEFLITKTSDSMSQSFDSSYEKAEETIQQSELPLCLRIGQWVFGIIGVSILLGILKGLGEEDGFTLTEMYKNVSWLFWLCGICILIWGILTFLSSRKEKSVLDSDEANRAFSNIDNVCEGIFSELSVPTEAKDVDILSFFYKMKNDDIKVCEKGIQIAPYLTLTFKIFVDSENLYIADLEGKYAFPLSSLISIKTVKKHIHTDGWNKDEAFDEGIYKQYKITEDNAGCIHCKGYHILEISNDDEKWGIYFPNYELPIFEELTGLKADLQ